MISGPVIHAGAAEKIRKELAQPPKGTEVVVSTAVAQRNVLAVSGGAEDVTAIYDVATGRKIPLTTREGTRGPWTLAGNRSAA